jgi:hypothetical protein
VAEQAAEKALVLHQGTTLVVPLESFYILSEVDTRKSAQYTMLSTLTTFGFVSGHDF